MQCIARMQRACRARVRTVCVQCACSACVQQCTCRVHAVCVQCACSVRAVHVDLGVQARRLLRELGLPAKLDLMAAMRRIGKWHKEQLKPKARGALAFVSDDPGAHRLFHSQLDKFAAPSCRNITKELARLRVELGGWLLREGYESAGAAPADFRNELIDSLPPTERDALMGGGGGGGGARPSRCPLFGRTNYSLGERSPAKVQHRVRGQVHGF